MAVVNVRVDDQTRLDLERLSRARGVTVSDLIREQLDDLLGRGSTEAALDAPTSLTVVQRRLLAQQHAALAILNPEEREYHDQQHEVLMRGFTAEYGDGFIGYESELSPADCGLVWDIFDMFTVLEFSARPAEKALRPELDEHTVVSLEFWGFDLSDQHEGRLLEYGRFLIRTDRWSNLADRFDNAHERGNSHTRMLPAYRRMLEVFRPLWQAKLNAYRYSPRALRLTAEELEEVAAAARHPDSET